MISEQMMITQSSLRSNQVMELSPSSSSSRAVHKHLWVILSHAHQRELLYFQAPHKDKLQPLNFSLLYRQMSRQRRQSNPIRQLTINARVSKGKLNTYKPSTYSAKRPAICILSLNRTSVCGLFCVYKSGFWCILKTPFPSLFPAVTATRHCPTCSTRASFCFLFRITFHGNLPASRHHSQNVPISIVEIPPPPHP